MASLITLAIAIVSFAVVAVAACLGFVLAMALAGVLVELALSLIIALAGAVHWIVCSIGRLFWWPFRTIISRVKGR